MKKRYPVFRLTAIYLTAIILCTVSFTSFSQNVAITDDDAYTANPSAMLDVKSLTKGMLVPRLTTVQRESISSPATGLLVFDTDELSFYFYNGALWTNLSSGNPSDLWNLSGSDVYLSDPNYNVGIGSSTPIGKLEVKGDVSSTVDEPLFEVINYAGDTVFAVYPEGVRIWVGDDGAKASKGGFAVGGFSSGKGITNEYLRVTPDSVRVYIDDEFAKASKGGFAVGGFSSGKGVTDDYLFVEREESRVYVDGDGGFAVGDISSGSSTDYLDLTPENYLIGHQAGQNITTGLHNSFFGYQAGFSNLKGSDNIFIGYEAGYNNTGNIGSDGSNNIFLGNRAGYNNIGASYGYNNIFIGYEAGYSNDEGVKNVFIGNLAGHSNTGTSGDRNVFIGDESGESNTSGESNVFIGVQSGESSTTGGSNVYIGNQAAKNTLDGGANVIVGRMAGYYLQGSSNTCVGDGAGGAESNSHDVDYNTFLGKSSGKNIVTGNNNVMIGNGSGNYMDDGSNNVFIGAEAGRGYGSGTNNPGSDNVFIGYQAGYYETGSNKLYIENSDNSSSYSLIYGEFDNDMLRFNGDVGIGTNPGTVFAIAGLTGTSSGANLRVYNNNIYYQSSSRRTKKNIKPLSEDFTKILKAQPVSFTDKATGENNIGYIAEDFDEIGLNNLVVYENGDPKSLSYELVSLYNLEIIKEQQKVIRELQKQNEEFKAEIDAIKGTLEGMVSRE